MKVLLPFMTAVALLSPSAVLACPYSAGGCHTCGSSLLGYGAWLLLGIGTGIASVAFERRSRSAPKAGV